MQRYNNYLLVNEKYTMNLVHFYVTAYTFLRGFAIHPCGKLVAKNDNFSQLESIFSKVLS